MLVSLPDDEILPTGSKDRVEDDLFIASFFSPVNFHRAMADNRPGERSRGRS
jgi:hypothetical protein